jgi:hypothetical protein
MVLSSWFIAGFFKPVTHLCIEGIYFEMTNDERKKWYKQSLFYYFKQEDSYFNQE